MVRTGVHTGRSPNDKFFVEDSASKGRIDWGKTNKPISPERYRALYNRMIGYAQRRDLFARDCWAGADPAHRIGVRVITETAWHNLFARNMFLRPRREELEGFKPDFTILNLPGFQADPALDGTGVRTAPSWSTSPIASWRSAAPGTPARSRSRCSPS